MKQINSFVKYYYQKLSRLKLPFIKYPNGKKQNYKSVSKSKMKEFNKLRYHGPKKLACYNPFVNLFFNSRGQAVVCCRNQDTVLGTYPENTINEMWFGEIAKKMREHMLNNDFSMGCGYCEHQFETSRFYGLPSMHADYYSSTKITYPKILELELSNNCNLQCVMCSGIVSSSIRKHREKKEALKIVYDDKFIEQLKEYLPHAKEIKFYGGEPFLIDNYYKIWDFLLEIKSKAKLHVVTNGTSLNDKVKTYLKNLNFTITVSFDAMKKDLFESIRVGANFEKVKSNILEYYKILGGKGLSLSVTPMKSNCREVPEIIDFCNSLNATINMSYVENPAEMALWTMTSTELSELIEFYKSYKFKPVKSVNSDYNSKAFSQFVNQISQYQKINSKIEKEYYSKLKTKEDCHQIIEQTLDFVLRENIIFESDKTEIYRIIKEIDTELSENHRKTFYGNLANFLETKGIISIKEFVEKGFDAEKLKQALVKLSEQVNIYNRNYKNLL
ncbi:MAG: twitch domain-containing radical SAM protein [Bacteroidales bacterium]|nr:twitch domain-containing radical SAM protein [Bacteroidales bacterium]MDY0313739.1 twitch domain-containing radical SAM protein [Bacteroidales bacterium]NLB86884.1 twitch domain-containing radical SAM protein [Bacteroidales bacterium]